MQPRELHTRAGIGWAFFGSVMAAVFLIPWKVAASYGDPQAAVLVLLTTAAVFNSTLALLQRRARLTASGSAQRSWSTTLRLAIAYAMLTFVGNAASAQAVARISGALLSVIQRTEVILVALLGAALLREPVRRSFWAGTALAGAGLWLLQQPNRTGEDFDPIGTLYGLASAACFGAMVVLARRFSQRLHLIELNAIRLWLSVLLWFAVERRLPAFEQLGVGLVVHGALAGFFGPFLSRLGALQSSRFLPAATTALASLATPALTLLLAFVLLGNLPTEREMLGGTVMLVGVAIPVIATARGGPSRSKPAR